MMEQGDEKPGFMDKVIEQTLQRGQAGWDKCKVCSKYLMPGSPMNKLYDPEIGSFSVCPDCSIKAIFWYVKKLLGKDDA